MNESSGTPREGNVMYMLHRIECGGDKIRIRLYGICGRHSTHIDIRMMMKLDPAGWFCHRIANIVISGDGYG